MALLSSLTLVGVLLGLSLSPVEARPAAPASAPAAPAPLSAPVMQVVTSPEGLELHASFVSATGWVKPGERFIFRVFVRNPSDTPATNVTVTLTEPPSLTFVSAEHLGTGPVGVGSPSFTWSVGNLAAGTAEEPTTAALIVEADADTLGQDPEIVWKDLSVTAVLDYDENTAADVIASTTHGPKVIPPSGDFESARYGDKPFPIVTAEYSGPGVQLDHQPDNDPLQLETVVNDPATPGSTFNLYQEMSYGQLYPHGTVPSAGIETAGWECEEEGETDCWDFTNNDPVDHPACSGNTYDNFPVNPYGTVTSERIIDGWYQLPGDTNYYGQDFPVFTATTIFGIDQACGQLGKAVYDSAHIADPEINYNDYDSNRDGIVDFFMLVFVGCGGNGPSQIPANCEYFGNNVPPNYDNIWPHSSDLIMQYRDPETGLRGYISSDQLVNLYEVPQCWTTEPPYTTYDDCAAEGTDGDGLDDHPVYVRVGPYNVNPETSFESASVISHEYGHHLGLPDFYNACCEYYGDTNLMAADYGQHMTIFSKQQLGWVVPEFIQPDETRDVENWQEIKTDTGTIDWVRPDGLAYTLSAETGDQNIHNGEAYSVKLPGRQIIDPEIVPSPVHMWWSRRGNDFGCPPVAGHNLDLWLPELGEIPADTPVTLEFMSSWDIEWDWDFGFLMTTTDGLNYESQPSEEGYTSVNTYNPNNIQCFEEHNHGITGTSGAYAEGEPEVTLARNPAAHDYSHGAPFLLDRYDVTELAGSEDAVVRFSYNTDGAFDRPGWFIDNVVVCVGAETCEDAGAQIIYESEFETDYEENRLFPGGCAGHFQVAAVCTEGWLRVRSDVDAPFDHAYYLELRDQSGFDFNGWEQSERGDTSWQPGVYVEYTDEWHGLGNNGVPGQPAQMYIDSTPVAETDCEVENGDASDNDDPDANCDDMSFLGANVAGGARSHYDDYVDEDQPEGYINSFEANEHPEYGDHDWHFDYGCLTLDVTGMEGQEAGPEPEAEGDRLIQDLTAEAVIAAGDGCVEYAYGLPIENGPPTAIAQARPETAAVGAPITFDGSRSFDDLSAPSALVYEWDFGDGTTGDGQTLQHSYTEAGEYTATLTVTDEGDLTDAAEVTVTITASVPSPAPSTPPPGGGASPTPSPTRVTFIPDTAGEWGSGIEVTVPLIALLAGSVAVLAITHHRRTRRTRR